MTNIKFWTKCARLPFIASIVGLLLTMCKPDVYVAGYIEMPGDGDDEAVRTISPFTGLDTTIVILSESKYYATLWKNGVVQYLTNGTDKAYARSVFVHGDDIYVAGYEGNFAMLWINGVAQKLTDGSVEAKANSVFVSETDVFVAGYEGEGYETEQIAKLWKNDVAQNLTTGAVMAQATSVFVSGNDVYVAVNERGTNGGAKIWKNGVAQKLSDASVNSVFVSGNDVYVAGIIWNRLEFEKRTYFFPFAQLWKNGVAQDLVERHDIAASSKDDLSNVDVSSANSVFVSGRDVYVLGGVGTSDGKGSVTLWKNGKAKILAEGSAYSEKSMFVHGKNVYVTEMGVNAIVYKNRKKQYLAVDETARGYGAFSVFVK